MSCISEEMSKSMQFSFNDLKLRGFAGTVWGFSSSQTQPLRSTDTSIGHTSAVRTFGINESASIFGSGSRDRTVKLWSLDVCSGIENWRTDPFSECLITYNGHRRTTISDVHFLTGGGSSGVSDVVASCDGQVHVSVSENIICSDKLLLILRKALGTGDRKNHPPVQHWQGKHGICQPHFPIALFSWWKQ